MNPFSPTAVARPSDSGPDTVTVLTPAIREAIGHLDSYLATRAGGATAVVGDYGTGKTHLAVQLLAHARRAAGDAVHTIYLDAPADTFLSLNRRFMARLSRDDVRHRLRDAFTEALGAPVDDAGPTREAEARFAQWLRRDLAAVTTNPMFGAALAMLLRPASEASVWDWLMGYPADAELVAATGDSGSADITDVEDLAVEAMGVFAMLYRRHDAGLVLVLDELDKILSGSGRPGQQAVARFERMLSMFSTAGAFLIIAGLPDILHVLGPDVKQRLGPIVKMSALSGDDVQRFICQTQLRAFGDARLAPFTPETTEYLTYLADGVARRVIRLCYGLYQRAMTLQSTVTHAMVREVVRVQFDLVNKQDVRAEVRRLLNVDGWTYQRDHLIGSMRYLPVDFWVPLEDLPAGCCLLLTESVLKSEEVEDLNRRVAAIRAAIPDSETVLIVVGYLPGDFAAELTDSFGIEPIVYDPQSFTEDLSATVKAVMRRLEQAVGADPLTSVRRRVERIHRQQANTQHVIEQLAARLDEIRSASDAGFDGLHRDLAGIPRTAHRHAPAVRVAGGVEVGSPAGSLPPAVARLFTEALRALDELTGFDGMLRDAFAPASIAVSAAAPSPVDSPAIRTLLRSRDVLRAVGTSVLLGRLIEAFRDGVESWFARRGSALAALAAAEAGTDAPTPEDLELLDRLCGTYDAIAEYLPLFQLDMLRDLTTPAAGRGDEPEQRARLTDARAIFEGLGARVRRSTLAA